VPAVTRPRSTLEVLLVPLLLGVTSVARAEDPLTGLELGGRFAYGIPSGKVTSEAETELDDAVAGQYGPWLDVGYRFLPEFTLGASFSYGFGMVSSKLEQYCSLVDECSITDKRVALQFEYHPLPGRSYDLWIGAGFGYEWLTSRASTGNTSLYVTNHGPEVANVQAGLYFMPLRWLGLGPFVSLSQGIFSGGFTSCEGECADFAPSSFDSEGLTLHSWVFLGLRTTLRMR
jgi:hypothetical protein